MGALILGVGGAVLGSRFVSDAPEPRKTVRQEGQLTRFEDRERKLSIAYPSDWERVSSPDPEVVVVAGSLDASMQVRTTSLGTPVERDSVDAARKLTDKLIFSVAGRSVKNLRPPRRVEDVGGLPGWLYIYSFKDAASGRRGAHAHYFLFQGERMITLVFQTLPADRFATYAPLFDRLATTFRAGSPDEESSGSDSA